jgi:hypothetical protein
MNSYREYIQYSERYIQFAKESQFESDFNIYLVPSIILAWSSIEYLVNNMLDDFSQLPKDLFFLHEQGLLLEKKVSFIDTGVNAGQFQLKGIEYKRLDDKILFLLSKFGDGNKADLKGKKLWQDFIKFKNVRDDIIHPRRSKHVELTIELVEGFIQTTKDILILISFKVWGKRVDL